MKFLMFLGFIILNMYIRDARFTKVYFIPTIHNLHKINPHYTYDSLQAIIKALHPSVIAVETRHEDLDADTGYLKQNYPYEMWMVRYWFPDVKKEGFDWLGNDIEGKAIPNNYWKEKAAIKKWEQALEKDSMYNNKLTKCSSIASGRAALLSTLSLRDLLESKDEELANQYYDCLQQQLKGSVHQRILDFYEERNSHILTNIERILGENKGKIIVILTGDDHYQQLKHRFPNDSVYIKGD